MGKKHSGITFVDLKFFLGLMFSIYGFILMITGAYYVFNPVSGVDSNIDIYWGLFMFIVGVITYHKSNKPRSWNRAFAVSGIERIERRFKREIEEVTEELE